VYWCGHGRHLGKCGLALLLTGGGRGFWPRILVRDLFALLRCRKDGVLPARTQEFVLDACRLPDWPIEVSPAGGQLDIGDAIIVDDREVRQSVLYSCGVGAPAFSGPRSRVGTTFTRTLTEIASRDGLRPGDGLLAGAKEDLARALSGGKDDQEPEYQEEVKNLLQSAPRVVAWSGARLGSVVSLKIREAGPQFDFFGPGSPGEICMDRRLGDIREWFVEASESGDFSAFVDLSDTLRARGASPAVADYAEGEGHRLLGDFSESAVRGVFHRNALRLYEQALEGSDPADRMRAFRGLGKLHQNGRHYDRAIACYDAAEREAADEARLASLENELLRVTRHRVDCIIEQRHEARRRGAGSLAKRLYAECDQLHGRVLGNRPRRAWTCMEWFFYYSLTLGVSGLEGDAQGLRRCVARGVGARMKARAFVRRPSPQFESRVVLNLTWLLERAVRYSDYVSAFDATEIRSMLEMVHRPKEVLRRVRSWVSEGDWEPPRA